MNTKNMIALGALLAVPALYVSCSQDYSTPQNAAKGETQIMQELTSAVQKCNGSDDVADLRAKIDSLFEEQKKITAAVTAMSPEDKEEFQKLLKVEYCDVLNEAQYQFMGGAVRLIKQHEEPGFRHKLARFSEEIKSLYEDNSTDIHTKIATFTNAFQALRPE